MTEISWGILIIADLFFGGMAGGAFVIGAWSDLFGKDKYRALAKSGIYTSLVAILIGLVFLVLDLGRFEVAPLGVLNAYLHFPESMMSVGTWTITGFMIVALIATVLWILNGNRLAIKLLEVVGMVLGFSTAAYTGMVLALARGRPFWNSAFLPWVFILTGFLTGLGLLVVGIPLIAKLMPRLDRDITGLFSQRQLVTKMLKITSGYTIVIAMLEILVIALFFWTVRETQGFTTLVTGGLSIFFWAFFLLGLCAPLALGFYTSLRATTENTIVSYSLLVAVLALAGGFMLRYIIVIAGQL